MDAWDIVDAIRFVQYLSPGQGDYTQERQEWVSQVALEDILAEMEKRREERIGEYEEVVE